MKLGTRVGLALSIPILPLLGMAAYQIWVIDRLVAQNREIGMVHRQLETSAVELREDLRELGEFAEKQRATGDPAYAAAAGRVAADVADQIRGLLSIAPAGEERRVVEGVAALWSRLPADGGAPEPAAIERLDARLGDLIGITRAHAARAIRTGAEDAARARRVSATVAIGCVVVAGLLSLALARMVTRPVRGVARAARDLAEGDFARRAPIGGPPELTALERDFNAMAERLGEIDRLKDTLVSNVSHDLKAPLASMHETNAALLDGLAGPLTADQRRLLERSQASNERLSRMVADLLDLSRIQGGAIVYDVRILDLEPLVRAAVADLGTAAEARAVAVEVEGPGRPVWVEADESLLVRVVENLLSNAIRHSPEGGTVRLDLEATCGKATLAVRDRGPGIPDADKVRVFERFYRTGARGGAGQGTGLGLAIAASIVEEGHGGSIRVEDEPGGGSRFVVELPAAREGSAARRAPAVVDREAPAGRDAAVPGGAA